MLLFYKPPHATPRCEVPISEAGSHGMGSGFRALNNQRTLAFVVFLCGTLAGPQLHYSPLPVSSSLSLLSLCLCDTAAGGVEAAVLARLHHVALPVGCLQPSPCILYSSN
jgi:hypothetical protein